MPRFPDIAAAVRDLVRGPGDLGARVDRNGRALLFLILALALLLRLGFLAAFHGNLSSRDEKGFSQQAISFVNGRGLGIAYDCPSSYRTPLYIFFVIPFHALFGESRGYEWPLGLAQVAVSVAGVWLVYRLGKEWRSERVGLLGALFMAVYPYNLYHDVQYYPTFLFTFFLLLTALGFLRLERTRDPREAALTGLWLGLAMLSTSGPMVFFAPLASFWLWRRWGSFPLALKRVAVVAAMSLLVMAPWIYRNWKVHRAFVPLTTDAGRVFYKSYNPWALEMLLIDLHSDATPNPPDAAPTPMGGIRQTGCGFMRGYTELTSERYWYGKAWEWVRANPEQVPILMSVRFVDLWRPWPWPPKGVAGETGDIILSAFLMNLGHALAYGFLLAFAVLEWILSTKEERKRTWLFALLAIAFSLTYTISYVSTKYRVPFDSVLAVMAAAAFWRFLEAYRTWRNASSPSKR